MKRSIIILLVCFVFGTTAVVALYGLNHKVVHEPNNFLRTYVNEVVTKRHKDLDLKYNSFYIAGTTEDHIYLGNVTNPFLLVRVNHILADTQHIQLKVVNMENIKFKIPVSVKVAPPYFYIACGNMPALFRGKIGEWMADRLMTDSTYYTQLVPIGNSSFGIRSTLEKTKEHILGKIESRSPHEQFQSSLLQKQVDGFFCTDGILNYNEDLKKLIYTYYYRNEYIVYDTNLNLDYRGHTIDTFSRAQIKIGYTSSEGANTLTYRKNINTLACTSGNNLFISSNLVAKNDLAKILDAQSVVDIYDLRNNTYRFSFTLSNESPKDRMKDFRIFKDRYIVALFDHHVTTFELRPNAFE